MFAAGVAALAVVLAVLEFVRRHPVWAAFLATLLVAAGVLLLRWWLARRRRRAAVEAERARHIGVTDLMSGPEFEQWVAGVLRRSGFSAVEVRGGPGDRGADILAVAPDGRRTVVQCKRHGVGNRVGSGAIQKFAGTCRTVHRGEICMIVTNGSFASGDGLRLAAELGLLLVDRSALESWAYTGMAPASIARAWAAGPPAT